MLYRRCASNWYLQAFSYLHRKFKIKSKRESWSWSNFKFASGHIKHSQTSHRRTAEICEYCKARKWGWFDFRFSIFRFSIFELSRKILFWYSKSYFDHRTVSKNPILILKILFWQDFPTQFECQNRILNVKIRFSDSIRISKNEKRKAENEKRKKRTKIKPNSPCLQSPSLTER